MKKINIATWVVLYPRQLDISTCYLRSTIEERNPNPGRSEIEIFSVVDGHQFSPAEDFLQGHNLGRELVYTLTHFHETKWPRFHVQRCLCCEETCFEWGKFQARKSNLSPKELLLSLDRSLREVCTTPWYICQPAVRRLVGKPRLRWRTTRHTTFKFFRGHIYLHDRLYWLIQSFTCKYRIKLKSSNYRLTLYFW